MASCLEGEFFQSGLHVYISSRLAGLVQPLQDGVSTIYVGGMMLVVVQS